MKTISLALLFASSTALAQPADVKAKAKAAADEAQQLYEAKDYGKAAEKFNYAYTLDPDPTYHFNAAQAYRQGGDCTNAKVFYQKFKDESGKDMSPQDLEKINKYIRGEGCSDRPQTNPNPPNPNPPNPNPPNPNPPNPNPPNPNVGTGAPIEPNPNPAQPSDTPHKSNTFAYGIGGVGLAAGAVAIGFWFAERGVQGDTDTLKATCEKPGAFDPTSSNFDAGCDKNFDQTMKTQKGGGGTLKDKGERDGSIAVISGIASGALVGTAVVLYLMNHGSSSNEHAFVITPTPGGAAATATFRF